MSPTVIEQHLIELLRRMTAQQFELTIAGGLGIYLKRRWIEQTGHETIFEALPDARATEDIDSFLALEIFIDNHVSAFRTILEGLNYRVYHKARSFQFRKPDPRLTSGYVKFDLQVKLPRGDEEKWVKIDEGGVRLGRRGAGDFETLNAWATPEAFGIDDGVQTLTLVGHDTNGRDFTGPVRIPHPFASLCMKITAAGDYETARVEQRDPRDRRHVFDVYLLVAMLSPGEVAQTSAYAQQFTDHPEMAKIRTILGEYFCDPHAAACLTLRGLLRHTPGTDLTRFCAVLRELFAP